MADICLVHLVRAKNGPGPFLEFVRAYSENAGGVEHDLVLIFKGFRSSGIPVEFRDGTKSLLCDSLFMRDVGFDIRAYRLALESFDRPYFCFLNSFSRPLDKDWLAKLDRHARRPGVGLVSATGSWESMYSNVLGDGEPVQSPSVGARLWRPFRLQLCRLFFKPLPNWHVRTNAFIISRELALQLWPRLIPTKRNAYLFEAGKRSLTARVLELGLDVSVVGRDGRAYSKEEWPNSKTYRAGEQDNLLVADKQTDRYQKADSATKRYLAQAAWGDRAFE